MSDYSVYVGRETADGPVVYIGITMQVPERRFSWHKSNGKNLKFQVIARRFTYEGAKIEEAKLIEAHRPKLNRRGIALPKSHVPPEELEARRIDPRWCKKCLRRHVNRGYTICRMCELLAKGATS